MAKNKEKESVTFAPSSSDEADVESKIHKSTKLPEPTKSSHKDLGLSDDDVIEMYDLMYLQRRFEERAMQMYQKGKYGGFLHLYMGQEAISTGTVYALNDDDDIVTAYRDHGFGLARGVTAKEGMAELYGKATGCSHGKGGSMHFAKAENHFWGGYGIVGAHIPVGAGLAFANKYNENSRIATCFIGDGAVNQGALHETFNMSKLWKLPVAFIVENNGYAMGTSVRRHGTGELYERAKGFDIKHDVINGMDVFTVLEKMREIAEDIRKNSEPWFLEIRTYRYRGHSMSDPETYRTKEELQEYKKIDPIERMRSYIIDNDIATKDELDKIDDDVEQEVLDAIDFAEESDFPDLDDLFKNVFVEDDYPFHK